MPITLVTVAGYCTLVMVFIATRDNYNVNDIHNWMCLIINRGAKNCLFPPKMNISTAVVLLQTSQLTRFGRVTHDFSHDLTPTSTQSHTFQPKSSL